VIILADDMGYSDPVSYGGEIATPSLDRLAENGLRFTQFYNTSRCVPTRASLLTGLYSHQAGLGAMTFDRGTPGYQGRLSENTPTIAELLNTAGYQTGMVGKWHLSLTEPREPEVQLQWLAHQIELGPFSPLEQYPTARGFQKFYGTIWGVVNYFDPFSLVYGVEPVREVPVDYYYTDAVSDSASAFIEQYSKNEAPFFLYVAYTSPHWPLHAPPESIASYEHVYSAGWDAIRQARNDRMVELGLIPGNALSPRIEPEVDWSNHADSAWDARTLAVHAAMVDRMDGGIGRILDTLERSDELENTLILFLSDNGASSERPSQYGPGFDRAGSTRDRRAVYFPVDKTQLPGPQTVHAGIGPMGANTVNTPFRWWKAKVHEGGIATPLIVHWPAGLRTEAGSLTDQPGHVIDLAPTLLDLAGAALPETIEGQAVLPMEGKSLLPIFQGERREPHEALFWEHEGAGAVRQGALKLVRVGPDAPWELYDLSTDRTELDDLAAEQSEIVAELSERWDAWAERVHVFPKRDGR
jgi:arylsulfatase